MKVVTILEEEEEEEANSLGCSDNIPDYTVEKDEINVTIALSAFRDRDQGPSKSRRHCACRTLRRLSSLGSPPQVEDVQICPQTAVGYRACRK